MKTGSVIDWASGIRSTIEDFTPGQSGLEGSFKIRDVGAWNSWSAPESRVLSGATLSRIQPDQIYQSPNFKYRIVAPLSHRLWSVAEVGSGYKMDISETTLGWDWPLVYDRSTPVVKGHGNSICTRCGCKGALVLFQLVECINPSCPMYKRID